MIPDLSQLRAIHETTGRESAEQFVTLGLGSADLPATLRALAHAVDTGLGAEGIDDAVRRDMVSVAIDGFLDRWGVLRSRALPGGRA